MIPLVDKLAFHEAIEKYASRETYRRKLFANNGVQL